MTKMAAIFRLQLFKVSEGFITQQALAFKQYRPVFVGQSLFGAAPPSVDVVAPLDGKPRWARALNQLYPSAASIAAALRAYAPQILHAHFGIDAVYALPVARALGIPLVTTLHGFDVTRSDFSLLSSCRPALVNGALWRKTLQKEGDLFICVSDFIRRKALEKGYPTEKLVVHYIGTDAATKTPLPQESKRPQSLIHVARLTEKKGTTYLLRAMVKIRARFPEAHLTIVGDGPLRNSLERETQSLGLENSVRFLGAKAYDETQKLIAQASALILPSLTASNGDAEGLGLVTQEAGAFGLPVVASDSGGIAEAVINGRTGFVVPEKNVDALSDRIARLFEDTDMAQQMGSNARAHIEANFDIRKQSAKLEALYSTIPRKIKKW